MFLNTIERENKLYELRDYNLSTLQDAANAGKLLSINENGELVVVNPVIEETVEGVAEVNGVVYNTIAEAIEAIEVEGTIVLINDFTPVEAITIPTGKTITLNLNGKTIKQELAQTKAYNMIVVNGTLIIDTVNGGSIIYSDITEYTAPINYVSNVIVNNGTLIIKNGTIKNMSNRTVAEQGYPHAIDTNGKLVIEGGYISNANYSAMRIWCTEDANTEVLIKGGTFVNCIDFQTVSQKPNAGSLIIEDGIFTVSENGSTKSVRLLGFGTDVDEMRAEINGGRFYAPIKIQNYVGGEMNYKVFNITGGRFAADVSEFVADGYEVFEKKGIFGVRKALA